ncbi:MAG: hypothetical protein CVV64_12760 [Candidatus Wallbacteria bacterium HGW-Wallbacteria-1]|jgi:GNAT superfamily N-acetyltransferase|uniref:N-acetyltransferase domain-containing protein n=1 Tax=Candidatus Wallbacteria bacterium HGW-Wallbacteria-1 TaxID=2013854 RepID=A0A2N1PN78_9BACT|nr:MAG: hypothetical protein CVV64_12760 [Candidatus Wallbacteria bacterium HGW-Wallbacteria-1]
MLYSGASGRVMNMENERQSGSGAGLQFRVLKEDYFNIIYMGLTFPSLRPILKNPPAHECLALAAAWDNVPVGLAITRITSDDSAELLSIFIDPKSRGRGIGSALISENERILLGAGVRKIEVNISGGHRNFEMLKNFVSGRGFGDMKSSMVMGKFQRDRIHEMKWVDRYTLPPGFEATAWAGQSEAERDQIIAESTPQGQEPVGSAAAWPYSEPELHEPLTSLLLRKEGKIMGWIVCHRIQPELIRYTHLYVKEEFQQFGLLIPLFAQALQLHRESGPERGIFAIRQTNDGFMNFFRKRLAPHLTSFSESLVFTKQLSEKE